MLVKRYNKKRKLTGKPPQGETMSTRKNGPERLHAWQQRYLELKQQMQKVDFVCVGSVQTRYLPCGTPGCRCHRDPAQRHGPYHYWTRKVQGRTVTVLLQQEEVALYREWIQNNRQLDRLVREMRRISARALSLKTTGLRS
jgi:hypothetical protein